MDKEAITAWSYGKLETLNLFIPRLMGGGSQEEGSEEIAQKVQQLVQENARSQQEVDNIVQALGSFTYWGDQPGTSGPAYQGGVVVFLALLGFFFASRKYRWWILGASILTILLAWGHNLGWLTNFFIDYIPFYNKFRAPSSILVVVELLLPFIAILGLYNYFENKKISKEYKNKILLSCTGVVAFLILIFVLFGKSLFGFHTELEGQYFPPYLLDYLTDVRYKMFQTDAWKALFFVIITALMLFLFLKEKISRNTALIVIGIVSLFDLWSVDLKYLNQDNFVKKSFAQNPFLTDTSEAINMQAQNNSYIAGLINQIPVNQVLGNIAEHDKSHYRVFNTILSPFNETNTSYFVNSIGGYSGAKLRRYDDLINKYFSENPNPEILNMLNTKYVIVNDSAGVGTKINPYANGPAWLVSEIKFAANPNEEIELIGKTNTKEIAVIGNEDRTYFNGKKLAVDSAARIVLESYQPNEIVYNTKSSTNQLAVFSEIYYPHGWEFFIDGKQTEYIKANYLLRAIYVPKGEHEIRMVFQPAILKTGKTASYASLGVFVLLAALGFWFYERKKSNASE